MLKRPTSRRKGGHRQIELNLVPFMDAMVTVIGFMLFTTTFFPFVGIETVFPQASSRQQQEKLKEKPLQLTVSIGPKATEIWSPFNRIPSRSLTHIGPGEPDLQRIHTTLLEIKQKFPQETKVVFAPSAELPYDTMIAVMDTIRTLEKTDPPIMIKNPTTGIDEPAKFLFAEIIFGNLLGS